MKKKWIPFISAAFMLGISSLAVADETEMDFYISEDNSEDVLVAAAEEEGLFEEEELIEDLEAAEDDVEGVPIDEAHFPDFSFRTFITDMFDSNHDNSLSESEINEITNIDFSMSDTTLTSNINSLDGIQFFSSLEHLNCGYAQLTSLDLSGCTSLKILNCTPESFDSSKLEHHKKLTSLIVTGCTSLTNLCCSNNSISNLDLSDCNELYELNCTNNQLTCLDISNCTDLGMLFCSNNLITELDLQLCHNLQNLQCSYNLISSLDISSCPHLNSLDYGNNPISWVDISNLTTLSNLGCSGLGLRSLDLRAFPKLKVLFCANNPGLILNISGCSNLEQAYYNYTTTNKSSYSDAVSYAFSGSPTLYYLAMPQSATLITSRETTHTHFFNSWVTTIPETCGKAGEETHTCPCGKSESRVINANGKHSWSTWAIKTKATGTKTGLKTRSCKVCGKIEKQTIPKYTVSLTKTKLKFKKGKKKTLKIKSMTKGDQILKWTTSKKKVATVNKKGQVKAKKKGKCVITVIMKSGAKAKCTITVK